MILLAQLFLGGFIVKKAASKPPVLNTAGGNAHFLLFLTLQKH
jgi:hypothetical protein